MRRSRTLAALALSISCALHGVTHAARPGDLDPSFGSGGTVRVPVPLGDTEDVLVLPGGSILLGGTGDLRLNDGVREFLVARLDANGALDQTFGNGGLVSTIVPLADKARVRRLALDPDGRIVAAGISETELATGATSRLLIMARYFADGQLDREFGFDGLRNSVEARDVTGLLVEENRSIDFVGRNDELILGRLSQGSGFGSAEFTENSDGADVVQHLDAVVIGGTVDQDFFLIRLLGGIQPDQSFGDRGDGEVRTPVGTGADRLRKLLVLPDGKIVAIGSVDVGLGDTDVALVRYTANGLLDATFGNGGVAVTALGPGRDSPIDAALAPDGTMLVGGQTCSPQCTGFFARFLPDGRLDPDFASGGVLATERLVSAVALPDDGHVLFAEEGPDELIVSRVLIAQCGNGVVQAGEACDDGNTTPGDCCDATCAVEADESPCAGDDSVCTADVCRAGTCAHFVPAEAGCLAASASTLTRVSDDRLRWSWESTTPVDRASFGDPLSTTDLTACVVAGAGESDRALLEITVPAAGTCGEVPCWKATRRGFRFRDPTAANGAAKLRLVTGTEGSLVELRARNLSGVADLPVPLKVRLVRHDASACFEATLGPARGSALEQ